MLRSVFFCNFMAKSGIDHYELSYNQIPEFISKNSKEENS